MQSGMAPPDSAIVRSEVFIALRAWLRSPHGTARNVPECSASFVLENLRRGSGRSWWMGVSNGKRSACEAHEWAQTGRAEAAPPIPLPSAETSKRPFDGIRNHLRTLLGGSVSAPGREAVP